MLGTAFVIEFDGVEWPKSPLYPLGPQAQRKMGLLWTDNLEHRECLPTDAAITAAWVPMAEAAVRENILARESKRKAEEASLYEKFQSKIGQPVKWKITSSRRSVPGFQETTYEGTIKSINKNSLIASVNVIQNGAPTSINVSLNTLDKGAGTNYNGGSRRNKRKRTRRFKK